MCKKFSVRKMVFIEWRGRNVRKKKNTDSKRKHE